MTKANALKTLWIFSVLALGAGMLYLHFNDQMKFSTELQQGAFFYAVIVALAFFAEYIDSSIGMGYGTSLTPILMIMGVKASEIVPAVLVSELVTGFGSSLLHHKAGNVDLSKTGSARQTANTICLFSIIGTILAVFLSINLPGKTVKLYIGLMIVAIGLFLLLGRHLIKGYSRPRVIILGIIAAFNKGISGGGFGPLLTGGQVASGVKEKDAIAITSLVEGFVCAIGLAAYMVMQGMPRWDLTLALTSGAVLSVPTAVWTVKVLPEKFLRASIGYMTLFLGIYTLLKVW